MHGLVLLLLAIVAAPLMGQSPAPLTRAAAFVKDYIRGVTENRFDVAMTLTKYDPAGKIVKTRKATCRLEFVKGRFKGAGLEESQEGDWESSIRVSRSNRRTVTFELTNDLEVLLRPAFVFGPDSQSKRSFEVSTAPDSGSMTVNYHSVVPCSTFEASGEGFRFKKGFCGNGQIQIDEHSETPMRTSIDALGLPLQSGKTALDTYHGESEFQYVSLAGTKQRLVFPKSATGTFEFRDGKVVLQAAYLFHPGKR